MPIMSAITPPASSEYPSFYATYINKVVGNDLITVLQNNHRQTQELIGSLGDEKANYRYAEGKWTIKEVMGHLIDAERIFAYRALRFARKDKTELSGFDESDFAKASNASSRDIADIMSEFAVVRAASIALFKSFDDDMFSQVGTANKNSISARALGYVIAGHEVHHVGIIQERYL